MKCAILSWAILDTLLSLSAVAGEPRDWLFRKYPHSHDCTLSTGEVIPFPFQVYDAAQLTLVGAVDLNDGGSFPIPSPEYEPVTISVPGHQHPMALVSIQSVQYKKDSLMPYNEFIFGFIVRKKSSMGGASSVDFMAALYLNEELPIRAGLELGGWNKFRAKVDYDFNSDTGKRVSVRSPLGELIFEASTDLSAGLPVNFPAYAKMGVVTTAAVPVKSVFLGGLRFAKVTSRDIIRVGDGSPWGRLLRRMRFRPLLWQFSPSFEMVATSLPNMPLPAFCRPIGG